MDSGSKIKNSGLPVHERIRLMGRMVKELGEFRARYGILGEMVANVPTDSWLVEDWVARETVGRKARCKMVISDEGGIPICV